jgi:uncharacterized protein YndB with AHSA1/START domain
MIVNNEKFIYVTYIASSAQKIWKALLEGELARQYWKHEQISDWQPGAKWQLVADDGKRTVKHVGKVVEILPNQRLVLTWGDVVDAEDASKHSRVAIDLETVGDMVRLTVTHENLGPDMQRRISKGWPLVLSSLKSFLETGRPLNF